MKKILIFFSVFLFSLNAYPFWIWSPKTQKWRNPKYSPLATPFLQFKEGEKYYDEKKYKDAYGAFRKVILHYPDAEVAAEAQYYLGLCLEELKQPYQAFLEYQKVIDSYPNSKRINEVVEHQYKIGEYFLNREPKQWLGVSLYDFVEHPSIEILRKIVEKVPYSPYAPVAEYKLGLLFMQLGRYDESRDAFQKVIDNYPENEWALPAKYQLAIASAKASPGIGYDSSLLDEARNRLDEFIKKHPDAQISTQAKEQLKDLRNKEAKKNFDIARFYEKQEKYDSAVVYYKLVAEEYSDSDYSYAAQERIKDIGDFLEGRITKKEFIRKNKELFSQEQNIKEKDTQEELSQVSIEKDNKAKLKSERERLKAAKKQLKKIAAEKKKLERQKLLEEKKKAALLKALKIKGQLEPEVNSQSQSDQTQQEAGKISEQSEAQ